MYKIEDLTMPPSNSQDLDLLNLEGDVFLPVAENDFNISSYLAGDVSSEETLDVAIVDMKYSPQIQFTPLSPRGPPERKIVSEKAAFEIEIDGSLTQKKKFLYSHLLNRIYVEMECNFSLNFNWDVNKVPQRAMYIRATVVFADAEQAEKRVERCLQHAHVTSNTKTTDAVIVNNVLRSAREMGDPNVFYCGNPQETDCWYSVVVQLNGPGGHAYNFVCKNSCSSGINRRAIDIIFTLEDSIGTVYGRQSVGARVCSCPRRDKNTQEQEFRASGGKRALPRKQPPAPAKKIKLEAVPNQDLTVVTIPKMDIVGPRAAITSLKVAHNMMDQMRATNRSHQQPVDDLDRCITNIKNIIDKLEAEYNTNIL
ncbi:cellular tumor antigen p53 [Maniola jurtina]|uniref:cellular tumor antigen p53 n=1 Tax=Maniola jurtina TaxID=191418 RepID=UPI001E68F566|nr:cellular tumor antigen p53 [Maniola jurtina]